MSNKLSILIALGGNALRPAGSAGYYEEQCSACVTAAKSMVRLVKEGHRLFITTGNGPQVGSILLAHQTSEKNHGPVSKPLSCCGAMSQGEILSMLVVALNNELAKEGIAMDVASIVTHTIVDAKDPAFEHPTKPVGGFMTAEEAEVRAKKEGIFVQEDKARGGFRQVVASPVPLHIIETPAIRKLSDAGMLVVSTSGGGIPCIQKGTDIVPVDAVIDKDLASSVLASQIDVDRFVILTDVPAAKINFNTPQEQDLRNLSFQEMEQYIEDGQFGAGSMLPKVKAITNFVKQSSNGIGVITSLETAYEALINNTCGTHVHK